MLLSISKLFAAVLCVNAVSAMLARRIPVRARRVATATAKRHWHRPAAEMEDYIQDTYKPIYARSSHRHLLFVAAMLFRTFSKQWHGQDTLRLLESPIVPTAHNSSREKPLLVTDEGTKFLWNYPVLNIEFSNRLKKYGAEIRLGKFFYISDIEKPETGYSAVHEDRLVVRIDDVQLHVSREDDTADLELKNWGFVRPLRRTFTMQGWKDDIDHSDAAARTIKAVNEAHRRLVPHHRVRIDRSTVERAKSAIAALNSILILRSRAVRIKAVAAVLLHSLDPDLVTIADARGIVGAFPTVYPYTGIDVVWLPAFTETGLKIGYKPWKYSIVDRRKVICQIYTSKHFSSHLLFLKDFTPVAEDYFHFDLDGIVFAVAHEDGRFKLHGRVRMDGYVAPFAETHMGEILGLVNTCWTGRN